MDNETDTGGAEGEWATIMESPIDWEAPALGPTTDVAFDLLSCSHRRFVLYCLHRHDGGIDLPRLAERVTRLFEESPACPAPDYDQLLIRLTHTTLPRLSDVGLVIYDRDADVVWPTEAIDSMKPLLELSATLDFDSEPAALENYNAE